MRERQKEKNGKRWTIKPCVPRSTRAPGTGVWWSARQARWEGACGKPRAHRSPGAQRSPRYLLDFRLWHSCHPAPYHHHHAPTRPASTPEIQESFLRGYMVKETTHPAEMVDAEWLIGEMWCYGSKDAMVGLFLVMSVLWLKSIYWFNVNNTPPWKDTDVETFKFSGVCSFIGLWCSENNLICTKIKVPSYSIMFI